MSGAWQGRNRAAVREECKNRGFAIGGTHTLDHLRAVLYKDDKHIQAEATSEAVAATGHDGCGGGDVQAEADVAR